MATVSCLSAQKYSVPVYNTPFESHCSGYFRIISALQDFDSISIEISLHAKM